MQSIRTLRFLSIVVCLTLTFATSSRANHGPGASGGGSSTISGETLKLGHYELTLREDYAQFRSFDFEQAAAHARRSGNFDALNHGFITTADFSYGITDDFQVGASIGYFIGRDFKSASLQPDGSVETSRTDPTGLTDAVFLAKYRVLKGQPGNLSIIGGVKAPTGRTDVRLANAELLGVTDQPGTGAWDFPIGLAYSRFLTPRVTIDASILYTFRTQHDYFKVGDRIDSGVALAYRLTERIKDFPQVSVFAELNDVHLFKDADHGTHDSNSGSNTLYLTPGGRIRFNTIYEHVNGDQGKVEFKMAVSLSFSN